MIFWKKRIYADAAAATPLSRRARRELMRLLVLFGNPSALHTEATSAKSELERARKILAESIGAHADEIILTASGTEANNLGIQGVLRPLLQKHGKLHAITSAIEHQSVLEPLRALKREGLNVTELPVDSEGFVDLKALREAIHKKTVFVSVQMINSEVGTIQPIRELAKEIRRVHRDRNGDLRSPRNIPLPLYFHTDACQAPLWLPVNVEKLGCDLATLDGQKVMGPKGVGCLYIKRGTSIEPVLWGGRQEKGRRGGTENVPLAGSFAAALKDAQDNVEKCAQKVSAVRDFLIEEIKRLIPQVHLNGPRGEARAANNVSVSVPGLDGDMAVVALDAEGIAVSTRSACTSGSEEPSHVIEALGVPKELAKTTIRITLLPDITKKDARHIARTLASVAGNYSQKT